MTSKAMALLHAKRKAEGVCACGGELVAPRKSCVTCRGRANAYYKENSARVIQQARTYSYIAKKALFTKYGGKCSVCGESRLPCLELDHINGGGHHHRRSLGLKHYTGGLRFYKKVLALDPLPSDLQILCANCHALKHCKWEKIR